MRRAGLAASAVGAFAVACSGAQVAPPDDGAVPPSSDADAGMEASSPESGRLAPPACSREGALVLVDGTAPRARADACDAATIEAALDACDGDRARCDAFVGENEACARCLFGALAGDTDPFAIPIGAFSRVGGALVAHEETCGAVVLGRADCTVPLARAPVCRASICAACESEADRSACDAAARTGPCAPFVDAACTELVASRRAEWEAVCRGDDPRKTRRAVARALCGG